MERDNEGRLVKEIKPLAGMRKVISERMTFSKHEYPQGTGQVFLEVSKMFQFRKELLEKKGIKVSFGDMYVKAAACALEENMTLNGSRQGDKMIFWDDINIKVTSLIGKALMEPVLEAPDQKNIEEIHEELQKIYANLRKGKLMKVKMEGGTFVVSNMGASLIDSQQPFLSPPLGAIFGISRNRKVPAFDENGNIVAANMTSFALTVDHGLNDGFEVTSFFSSLQKVLDDPWTYMYHIRERKTEEE